MSSADSPKRIDVALYGIVSAGKSSLINALAGRNLGATSPIGGTTKSVSAENWREVNAAVGPYEVRLIDTPGIQEVQGGLREAAATEAARNADLVLFVTAEDLTATAHDALRALRMVGKPLIVAVNKMDLLEPEPRTAVLHAIRLKLAGEIEPEDVIGIAAAPVEREFVADASGAMQLSVRRGEPQVSELEARLIAAIEHAAPELKLLAEAHAQVEQHRAEREENRAARRARAERVADETSVAMALALAANPLPLLDFLASSGGLAILVKRVGEVYEATPSAEAVRHLANELLRAGSLKLWGSMAAVGVGGALKFIPGIGHVAGSLTQAAAGGYVAHVLGRALVDYYENGHDWGTGGVMAALDRVAQSTDRVALTRGLVDRLRARLREGGSE